MDRMRVVKKVASMVEMTVAQMAVKRVDLMVVLKGPL